MLGAPPGHVPVLMLTVFEMGYSWANLGHARPCPLDQPRLSSMYICKLQICIKFNMLNDLRSVSCVENESTPVQYGIVNMCHRQPVRRV